MDDQVHVAFHKMAVLVKIVKTYIQSHDFNTQYLEENEKEEQATSNQLHEPRLKINKKLHEPVWGEDGVVDKCKSS